MGFVVTLARKIVRNLPGRDPGAADTDQYGVTWVEHNIPDRLPARRVYPAKVRFTNTGDFTWLSTPPDGRSVDLVVRLDDEIVATHKLPRGEVPPGGEVCVRFPFTAPSDSGSVTLRFELVRQKVALFLDRGVVPLTANLVVDPPVDDRNDDLWATATARDPWCYQPTQGIARGLEGHTYPVFAVRSKGCKLWDASEREYLDYVMGWGAILLGYGDDRVNRALKDTIDLTAPIVPYPHVLEMEVAEMLCEDIPSAEMAIFGKNGSDVCTLAARTARVLTGRHTILFAGYHGWQDWWVEQLGFEVTGVPGRERPLVHRYRFNDRSDFDRLYKLHKADLAAVMIEPSGPWGGDEIGWEPDADPAFLAHLAKRTRDAGALLVFDEIVTGYRYPGGSVQAKTGVVPDMTCLGKALASGMPLSALVGRADVFKEGLPRTWYGPTFKWEVYSLAAARAAIGVYRSEPVADFVWDYGTRLIAGIREIVRQSGVAAEVRGPPFRFNLMFKDENFDRLPLKKALYTQELLRRGLSTYNGIMLPCYAHDEETMRNTLEIVGEALTEIAEAERSDDFDRRLEIPPLVDL